MIVLKRPHAALAVAGVALLGLSARALIPVLRTAHGVHPKSGKPITIPGRDKESTLLFSGWKISPAGRPIPTGDFLLGGAFSPDGKIYAISNCGYNAHALHLIDVESEKEITSLPMSRAWNGIAWAPDGARIYVSGGISNDTNDIYVFEKDSEGKWKPGKGLKLTGAKPAKTCVAGMRITKDGKTLFALNLSDGMLYALDTSSGSTVSQFKIGDHPIACGLTPDDHFMAVACWGGSEIVALDVSNPAAPSGAIHIPVGEHPNNFALSRDGRLYISCGNEDAVKVYDIATGRISDTIKTALTAASPEGSTPDALAISPDSKTLYVANGDNNDVCVVDVSDSAKHRVLGFIPTGWYPTSLAITRDGKRLIIGSGKGTGTGPNPVKRPINTEAATGFEHHGHQLRGLLSFVDVPDEKQLAEYTRQVVANTPYKDSLLKAVQSDVKTAIPTRVGTASPIKHVLYIIKENRTYDQVLGDIEKGNGDKSLCLFGEDVTPNHHALAQQYVLLDNLYCSGEVSADGHPWCTSAYATDFTQRAWVLSYSKKGTLPASNSVSTPRNGYLWDECKRKGLSYRSYGEYIHATSSESAPEPTFEGITGLKGHASQSWMGPGAKKRRAEWRDTDKAEAFITEFKNYEQAKTIPQFMVMSLGEDHTSGTRAGAFTPKASVASNDQALGKIVEAISHSSVWKEFAIFVIEDDAQNGPDHIDSHRTVGLIISPYTKRGIVDSTMYQTTSMIRTMELILGLDPLSQYDAAATPMFASFTNKADLTPYVTLSPRIDLTARNKPTDVGAKASARLDWSDYDRADPDTLNRILWQSIKGPSVPLPRPRHQVITVSDRHTDND